jgi:S-DNA-T family DNA segregation ATPase FtsK/SpoIIIE
VSTATHTQPTPDRPALTLVKEDATQPVEGTVVEHQGATLDTRPEWLTAVYEHARANRLYLPQIGRGYLRVVRRWFENHRDGWPQQIATAKADLKAAKGDSAAEMKARAMLRQHRADYRRHRGFHALKTSGWAATAGACGATGTLAGGGLFDLGLGLAALGLGAWHGRPGANPSLTLNGPEPVEPITSGAEGQHDLITALVAAKIITEAQRTETRVVGDIHRDGPGWGATVELPRDMEAAGAIAKVGSLASSLRIKKQRIEIKADTSAAGHEGRFTLWVADSDNPYNGPKVYSQLVQEGSWDFWNNGVPLGLDARGRRTTLPLLWSSLLIGGLQDYGKSYLARLVAAAATLDPHIRIVLISGKVSPDWLPLEQVADKYIVGADPATIRKVIRLLDETILDMQKVGDELTRLYREEPATCPEGKLTRELAKRPGMSPTLFIVEELQELLDAADLMKVKTSEDEEGEGARARSAKDVMVESMARFVRVTRFVGGMGMFITQRPDSDSVPTKLREVCVKRACFRVKGDRSARMVLGDDAVAGGASPHLLTESNKGVFVLDQGAESGHTTQRGDVIDLPEFMDICRRGRQLRIDAGKLTGYAAEGDTAAARNKEKRQVVADSVALMIKAGVDRMRTETLAEALSKLDPDLYGDLSADDLKARMQEADAGVPVLLGPIGEWKNPRGFKLKNLESLIRP